MSNMRPQEDFQKLYGKYFARLPDIDAYLKRIGLDRGNIPLTKDGLDMLQFAHLCTVPFENLDLFDYDVKVDFGIEEMFEKVIHRMRGGYCFELNSIYMELLRSVGFEAYPVGVRILAGRSFIPAIAHRGAVVTINGKRYYTDVGYGASTAPIISVCIDDYSEQDIMGEVFSVGDRPHNNKVIFRHTDEGKSELFMFDTNPFYVLDFITYNTTIQATGFRTKRMVNLRTRAGSKSIDGDIFRRTENGVRTEIPLPKPEDAFKVLAEEFGMILTEPLKDITVI